MASSLGRHELISPFLKVDSRSETLNAALRGAVLGNHCITAKALVDAGADGNGPLEALWGGSRHTPTLLHLSVARGYLNPHSFLTRVLLQAPVSQGVVVDVHALEQPSDCEPLTGMTEMMVAAFMGDLDALGVFVTTGGDVEAMNGRGETVEAMLQTLFHLSLEQATGDAAKHQRTLTLSLSQSTNGQNHRHHSAKQNKDHHQLSRRVMGSVIAATPPKTDKDNATNRTIQTHTHLLRWLKSLDAGELYGDQLELLSALLCRRFCVQPTGVEVGPECTLNIPIPQLITLFGTIRYLVQHKRRSQQSSADQRELHGAAAANDPQNITQLVQEKNVDVNCVDYDGHTPLMVATIFGSHQAVETLLKLKADCSLKAGDTHMTALLLAAENGHQKIVANMIQTWENSSELQERLAQSNEHGDTAAHLATVGGHSKVMRVLMEAKACVSTANAFGETPLHLAAEYGSTEIAKMLVQGEEAVPMESQTSKGKTSLHLSVQSGHVDITKLLIDTKANVNTVSHSWRSPLMDACSLCNQECVKMLLENGAEALGVVTADASTGLARRKWSEAAHAIFLGDFDLLSATLHLTGARGMADDPDANSMITTLHAPLTSVAHALDCRKTVGRVRPGVRDALEIFNASVDADGDNNATKTLSHEVFGTVLRRFCGRAYRTKQKGVDVFPRLLYCELSWLDPNHTGGITFESFRRWWARLQIRKRVLQEATRRINEPALFAAVSDGDAERCRQLVESQATNVNCQNLYGLSPLLLALQQRWLLGTFTFIELKADVNMRYPPNTAGNVGGETALVSAARMGGLKLTRLLLKAGATQGVTKSPGESALAAALKAKHYEVARLLVKTGDCPVNEIVKFENGSWKPPLHCAMADSQFRLVRRLIAAKADVNAVDNNGSTALFSFLCCAEQMTSDYIRCVRSLVKAGADINLAPTRSDGLQMSPMMLATYRDQSEMVAALLSSDEGPWGKDFNVRAAHTASFSGSMSIAKAILLHAPSMKKSCVKNVVMPLGQEMLFSIQNLALWKTITW